MPTRRQFVTHTAVSALAGFAAIPSVQAVGRNDGFKSPKRGVCIKSVVRRDETIVRHGGHGDIFPLTWTREDRQFSSFSDGGGFSELQGFYNTRGLWVDEGAVDASFQEMATYPDLRFLSLGEKKAHYYGFGALAVADRIYHFLCCDQKPKTPPSGWGWCGVKLIYSPDEGRTWHNQDGSTPVVWESYAERSSRNMLFFEEPQEAFSLISLLQMGRNYGDNRDGYVYGYGTNGNTDGIMNQLVMFRVATSRILDRSAYEFFGGMTSDGNATWVQDIRQRAIVHTFPLGWVNKPRGNQCVVQSWLPSVVYNAPLGVYLMASSGVGSASDGEWFSRPSYLGFWTAPHPWGPWKQIHEETAWLPGNDALARCYSPQISPKWIAPDGKSFWLVWTDFQDKHAMEMQEGLSPQERVQAFLKAQHRSKPYYAFNTQRVDLIV